MRSHLGPSFVAWSAIMVSLAPVIEAQQVTDTAFRPIVESPAFDSEDGPVVLVDEAHNNFHTLSAVQLPHTDDAIPGRLTAFRELLAADGYRVEPLTETFSANTLPKGAIFVIANALATANVETWALPNHSAFDRSEIAAIGDWVQSGGSLLLIADHQPWAAAAADLAESFGLIFNNGYASDADPGTEWEVFSTANGALHDHPIVRGRTRGERVDAVMTFGGQAFRPRPGVELDPLFVFPTGSELVLLQDPFAPEPPAEQLPRIRVDGMLQGATLRVGEGRLAVFGEAAMFTAQVTGPERQPMGLNHPEAKDNTQFVLNVMHWLSGLIPN